MRMCDPGLSSLNNECEIVYHFFGVCLDTDTAVPSPATPSGSALDRRDSRRLPCHTHRTHPHRTTSRNQPRTDRSRPGPNSSRRSRSEERRVGKECRSRWAAEQKKKKSRKIQSKGSTQ